MTVTGIWTDLSVIMLAVVVEYSFSSGIFGSEVSVKDSVTARY